MIEKVDHIGIAVPNLEEALSVYRDVLGLEFCGFETVVEQKVRVAKLKGGNDTIELLEPTEDDSPIGNFLKKRGPGIHHVCLAVDNIEETLERFKAKGLRLIDETPRIGAGGCRIAFVHPKSTGGVLIELSEKAK
ncbi:MAG: methylmalonyl-CoA/ethylmalonyl-CoA epimerase [Planctomycetota bacterium]|jgi:methylmalonyl-CoA/ethylmalonyl-CoA epimerase